MNLTLKVMKLLHKKSQLNLQPKFKNHQSLTKNLQALLQLKSNRNPLNKLSKVWDNKKQLSKFRKVRLLI